MTKKLMSFKFSEALQEVLNELVSPDSLVQVKGSKTQWLEMAMAYYLYMGMKGKVDKRQLPSVGEPEEVFEFWLERRKQEKKGKK